MRYRVEAHYRTEHAKEPALLYTVEDVDALIDSLLTGPVNENLAQLFSAERPLLPSGVPDHELLAGVDRSRQVGVLAFMDDGNWVSLGKPTEQEEIAYYLARHWTGFPGNSEIPVELVRQAVKEFLVSGGQRPMCVEWQVPEYM
jgi:hypothetical protein